MSRKSGKIMDIQETLKDYNISIKDIGNNDIFINSLSKEAAKVPDYRHPSYVKHKLQDILSICILGFLADCNEQEEIADFVQQKEKWLKKYLELPNGIPYSDTIRLVAGNIDAAYFYQAVVQSLEGLVNDVQAVMVKKKLEKPDGKTVEEKKYYISSLPVDVELFSKAAGGHWGVEAQLHQHLDFTFRDDYNTTTEKTCAKNMQMLKKIALAILHIVQALYSQSLKRIRKTIAMDCEKELENILSALSADIIKAALYKASD